MRTPLLVFWVLVAVLAGCGLSQARPVASAPSMTTPTPIARSCPITYQNGSTPPGESSLGDFHGNGKLWTQAPGTIVLADGSDGRKFQWWRGTSGQLVIRGRRLDGDAPPLRAEVPEGYGSTGHQATGIIFPTAGCWEITGEVGDTSLTLVVRVLGTPGG
jgi:hypothetical protein